MNLTNRVAIITGAGRGIGKNIAHALSKQGAKVVVTSRTASESQTTASEIESIGYHSLAATCDVSNKSDVQKLVDLTIDKFGTIDILVNNAGVIGPIGPLVENEIETWISGLHINLIGTFLLCKAVLPTMIAKRQGKIINLAGGGACYSRPFFSAYATSKAGVVRLTECLADELMDYNIQVNAIAPGAIATRMQDDIILAGHKAGEKDLIQARTIKNGGGSPSHYAADLAVFLSSYESDHLTGRLISAVWDNWQNIDRNRAEEVMSKDLFTLRRIDEMFFYPKKREGIK